MNIILLSGGSGKRLWPLSNDVRSKQFIKIFRKPVETVNDVLYHTESKEQFESMVQRVYRQIKSVEPNSNVIIATSKSQVSAIHNQIGSQIRISVEPCRRDTFPAISLSMAYLHDIMGVSENEAVVVCPVDPYVDDDYFVAVKRLWQLANESIANIVLMGINPTYPSEKYGYIIPESKEEVSKVVEFKEKPEIETAKAYIERGGLWNGGVFALKVGYALKKAHEYMSFDDYNDLYSEYANMPKKSFDYAVVEKEPDISVLRFSGRWMDIGTWNTISEAMDEKIVGRAIMSDTCENVNVINELGVPILAVGLKDVIISASAEGILVSNKEQSSGIKPIVDEIKQEIMFAERSWGDYRVIDLESDSMTVKVTLKKGCRMNYHSHDRRDEVWNIISGEGFTVVDGMRQRIKSGDVITIAAGSKHTVIAETELKIIEIQLGKNIDASDKHKYEFE